MQPREESPFLVSDTSDIGFIVTLVRAVLKDMILLVTFKTLGNREHPVGMVCRLTGDGAFTSNEKGFTASLVTPAN